MTKKEEYTRQVIEMYEEAKGIKSYPERLLKIAFCLTLLEDRKLLDELSKDIPLVSKELEELRKNPEFLKHQEEYEEIANEFDNSTLSESLNKLIQDFKEELKADLKKMNDRKDNMIPYDSIIWLIDATSTKNELGGKHEA